MNLLFIFLDGIGLGTNDADINPFARAKLPFLEELLDGQRLLASAAPYVGRQATLLSLDASAGVSGLPQSATGQAILLTGQNIPAQIGYHYGPKPNPEVAAFLAKDTLFHHFSANGHRAALLNAFPARYFEGVNSGRRLYSAIPLAVVNAGLRLFTAQDLYTGNALSADFIGQGWHTLLNDKRVPLLSPEEAGRRLFELAGRYDFSLFEYWASDYAGHKQNMDWAVEQLVIFDGVLAGLFSTMFASQSETLVVITSDHGNMEDLSTRRHTNSRVPCLLIGASDSRARFSEGLTALTHVAPAIRHMFKP